MVKAAITTVSNYEKDRIKDHWRVNVMINIYNVIIYIYIYIYIYISGSPPSIQGEWLAIDDLKNNILASLCLASYVAANWLKKLETKYCVEAILLRKSYFCSCVSHNVCVVSQFDLSITKQNYLLVRCQSLSHT